MMDKPNYMKKKLLIAAALTLLLYREPLACAAKGSEDLKLSLKEAQDYAVTKQQNGTYSKIRRTGFQSSSLGGNFSSIATGGGLRFFY